MYFRKSDIENVKNHVSARMKRMKAADLKTLDPSSVARTLADNRIKNEVQKAGEDRAFTNTVKIFGCRSADANDEFLREQETMLDEYKSRVPMNSMKGFLDDVNDSKDDIIFEPIKDKSNKNYNIILDDEEDIPLINNN